MIGWIYCIDLRKEMFKQLLIEGREGLRMTKCVDGEWQEQLKKLYMSSEAYMSM